tara:strand:- start:654 stop:1091 length:438 start_codon:yes stop_codon:yes gene_type:complete
VTDKIKSILTKYNTIAMVGVSKDENKPSTIVMKYMQKNGFKVVPVNPSAKGEKILGEEVFEKLEDIKIMVDIVDIFRPSVEATKFAEESIKIGAKVFWLQLGIKSTDAKELVESKNIEYIENRCTKIEYQKILKNINPPYPALQG